MALETLGTIKNPPIVYAKQANIAHGPQQVNNGPASATRTEENRTAPTKLLEQSIEQPVDTGTPGTAGAGHSQMETMGAVHRAKKRRG